MNRNCTVLKTANFIGKRWTMLILLELYKGQDQWKRYTHLKGKLPDITPKMLSARLKELEREGMISRRIDARMFPIKAEYSLTDGGKDFVRILRDIKKWSLKWKYRSRHCESRDCKTCKF